MASVGRGVGTDLVGCIGEVHDPGVTERAEPEAEVERRPRDDDEIGAPQRGAAGAREREPMVGREQPAPEPVGQHRHARSLGEARSSS